MYSLDETPNRVLGLFTWKKYFVFSKMNQIWLQAHSYLAGRPAWISSPWLHSYPFRYSVWHCSVKWGEKPYLIYPKAAVQSSPRASQSTGLSWLASQCSFKQILLRVLSLVPGNFPFSSALEHEKLLVAPWARETRVEGTVTHFWPSGGRRQITCSFF